MLEIPASFHLPGAEVCIRQIGNSLILEPLADDWQWLKALSREHGAIDEIQSAVNEDILWQERPELDEFFK